MNSYYKYSISALVIIVFGFLSIKFINTLLTFNNYFELNDSKSHLHYSKLNENEVCNTMEDSSEIKLKFEFKRMFVQFNGRIDIEDVYSNKNGILLYSGPFKEEIVLSKCINDTIKNNRLRLNFSFYKDNELYFLHTKESIDYDMHKSIKIIINSVEVPSSSCNVEYD